jgi:hypothetical protein
VKKQGHWGPDYWILRYGDNAVTLEDCDTGEVRKSTVAEYLHTYGVGVPRRKIWKLKVR